MATGDIIAASISSDGMSISITFEGMSDGGTHDLGMGTYNDPSSASIQLSVTSEGYNTSKVLGTTLRTVYGIPCKRPTATGAMRQIYPDQASPQETVSGSDLIVVYALSNNIYDDDTSITLDAVSGLYNDGSNDNNSASSYSVTNNSTLDYPKVIGNWATPNRKLVESDFDVEFLAFHGFAKNAKQVACVEITATDEHSNSVSSILTDMSISSESDVNKVLVYKYTVPVSTLTDGDLITIEAQAYPWVGDADSIIDTDDAVNTFPTPLYTNLVYRLDKSSDHGHVCVSTDGDDGTGTVYSSQSLAEAGSHFLTIAAALTALQTYHNTYSGHNDAGGGTIYLDEDTWTLNSSNGGTLTEWVTITRQSTASKANVILCGTVALSAMPTLLRLYDITHNDDTGDYYWYGTGTKSFWIDSCAIAKSSSIISYSTPYNVVTWCTGSVYSSYGFRPFSTSNSPWGLIRGNNMSTHTRSQPYVVIGNKNIAISERASSSSSPAIDNGIYAYNTYYSDSTSELISLAQQNVDNLDGFAIVQNIMERHGSQTSPLMYLSGDGSTTTTNNILLFHNTFAGARANLAYNDISSGGPYSQTNWFEKNNIWSNWNNKDDTFGSNADATGGKAVGYGLNSAGNLRRSCGSDEWLGEFEGLLTRVGSSSTPLEPEYVSDLSADGSDTGGGDYQLNSNSPAIGLVFDFVLPYDIIGNTRESNGAAGAYEYIVANGNINLMKGLTDSILLGGLIK